VSPDGKQLAAHRVDQATGNWDIWVSRIDTKIARRLTTHAADDQAPIWSRDGRQIVFASLRDTLQRDLYLISATAPDTETLLLRTPNYKTATDWSPDGKHVLYTEVINSQSDLLAFSIEGDRKPIAVAATKFTERSGHFSPDGKWVTYDSNATGRDEIYITSFPPSREVVQVSSAGGTWPIWSADGREIYYLSGSDEVMAVPVRFENGVPAPGSSDARLPGAYRRCARRPQLLRLLAANAAISHRRARGESDGRRHTNQDCRQLASGARSIKKKVTRSDHPVVFDETAASSDRCARQLGFRLGSGRESRDRSTQAATRSCSILRRQLCRIGFRWRSRSHSSWPCQLLPTAPSSQTSSR
jgi:roadblock/LC7 domain-containing protein